MTQPKIKLKDYDKYGHVLDVPNGYEMVHKSVNEFVNYACDQELATSHKEYGANVQNDPLYRKYKTIKDEQALTVSELKKLLGVYQYMLVKELE